VNRLLIIDGHAYAYRAFHAIRELRGPDGQPTNAIYGFLKMFEKMRLAVNPTHVIVVWDGGLSAERMAVLPDYKAQRSAMPNELKPQFNQISECLNALGVAEHCADGVEADDYIGCLARQAAGAGWKVVIASADKDFMQLVSAGIGLLNPNDKTGAIWGRTEVVAKAGVEPEQIVDWLALMGDAVDNIPGVPGVGAKTSAALLKQFNTIDSVYLRLPEVKSEKLRDNLRSNESLVRRNVNLVALANVACDWNPDQLMVRTVNAGKLRSLYEMFGFNGLLAALKAQQPEQAELI
jgi:DNA polymerase-1